MTDARELQRKAAEAFAKGRYVKAVELYAQYLLREPKDFQARLRMGDAHAKMGASAEAIAAYQAAAEGFVQEGFFPRAIAAHKLVLDLDAKNALTQRRLSELCVRRPVKSEQVTLPAPPAPAAMRLTRELQPGDSPISTSVETPVNLRVLELDLDDAPSKEAVQTDPSTLDFSPELPPELDASLFGSFVFDELSLEDAGSALLKPASFSSLDVEGGVLLRAVENAAQAGRRQRGERSIESAAEEFDSAAATSRTPKATRSPRSHSSPSCPKTLFWSSLPKAHFGAAHRQRRSFGRGTLATPSSWCVRAACASFGAMGPGCGR